VDFFGHKKTEHKVRFLVNKPQLFDFRFFENHMLANNRIKFFDLKFSGHGAFVFSSGVKKTSTSTRH
jgi:hypothetical protein